MRVFFRSLGFSLDIRMQSKIKILALAVVGCTTFIALAETSDDSDGATDFWDDSEWGASVRFRYEQADDNFNEKATALTARLSGYFQSGEVADWIVKGEVEHVSAVDSSSYNDGGSNGVFDKAVIADPAGTELNQLFARFSGLENTSITIGRHQLEHRKTGALQRYLSTVSFRQNEQTVDGLTVAGDVAENVEYQVSYLYNINRIFGEDNPIPTRANFELSAIAARAGIDIENIGNVEGFFYHMDFDEAINLSARTIGGRLKGQADMDRYSFLYIAELASQTGIGDNPSDDSIGYSFIRVGMKWREINDLTIQVAREALAGDGNISFRTPLARLHAFQGSTDKFLATPLDGVVDTYLMATAQFGEAKLALKFHDFQSDKDSYAFGSEWATQAAYKFDKFSVGGKLARYTADKNPRNLGIAGNDTAKVWIWFQTKF